VPLKAVYPDLRMPTSFRHRLIQEIIDWKPDVVHSQCEFFSYQFASRISRITGAPLIHTYHTLYEQYLTSYVIPSRRAGDFLAKYLSRGRLRKVDTLVAPTQKVESTLHHYGMKAPISVVPSGISLEQHQKRLDPQTRLEKRRSLGLSDDDLVLLNLGRLGGEKNLGELITLFTEARKENENLKFLIVGDGPAREDLEKLAVKLGVREHVIFTGMVSPAEVQDYYQLGDVFVSASTSETQGLTYVEAAANGLPLLCRRDPCLDGVLVEGRNGFEYEAQDDFCELLDTILQNPDWCHTAGEQSAQIAENFDKSHFAEQIEDVYEAVIS
jgi:1,2-diacylglycerol 3-alpha-glucosyltransferase